ncbi:O-antigen ligase family protein [Rhodanobacter sp. C03]|uniref:O-antigen ligase family protein n=1 Tax=Rhodanobacter sp. C03 TaxID=1945858 RepID=UPI000985AE02|nr:O-antigen ligase family protein [Rhodanobacter sp. C03]OOG53669.1 O-antigen polymerase [Rhodanobacter sp. C03]
MFILSLLYLVLTIIRPQDYMPGLAGVPVLPVVLLLAFALWLSSAGKALAAPQFLILPIFLLVMLLSDMANGWLGGAAEQLMKFGPVVIAFFVLATAVSASQRRVVITFAVFALCAMVLALHGVDQFNNGVGWTGMGLSEDSRIQYVGIFNDPNDLGLLFVTTWPMALYLSSRGGFPGRVFWLAGAALLLYGIYLTNSRGAFLAVMVIVAVYLWRKRGFATSLVLSSIGMMGLMLMKTRAQDISVDDESAFGRVDAWYEGLHMFLSHPLLGIGAGNFTDYNDLTAHNSFVLVLAETGFLGYVLWLAFVGYSFMMTLRILRNRVDASVQTAIVPAGKAAKLAVDGDLERESGIALTLLLSLCGMFAAAFFLSRSYMIVMYLLIAVVVGNFVRVRERIPEISGFSLLSGGWRWMLAAMGSIVFLVVIVTVLMHSA